MSGFVFGSLFSGAGLADIGLTQAGGCAAWAVDTDHAAADCYERNHGAHVIRQSVETVDPHTLAPVDLIWASPPCPSFSQARSKALPSRGDEWLGLAIIPYVEIHRPRIVLVENVPPYAASPCFAQIVRDLFRLGYMVDWSNVCASDHGVPQTRNRLILRAVQGTLLPPLPAPLPVIGWYAAIADLIPALPESRLADWQLRRLAEHPVYGPMLCHTITMSDARPWAGHLPAFTVPAKDNPVRAVLVPPTASHRFSFPARGEAEPATTVLTGHGMPRAYLVSGTDGTVRAADQPSVTVTASLGANATLPAIWKAGHVVSMTPRALARFMAVPDDFVLPVRRGDACRILGNGVPPPVARRIVEGLISALAVAP